MARRKGIYKQNSNKLTFSSSPEEKVFNYLIKHQDNGATQTQMAKDLGISQSTVSRTLASLDKVAKFYGQKKYTILCKDGKYFAKASLPDINEEIPSIDNISLDDYNISNPKIWTKKEAEKINPYVIFYPIKKSYATVVYSALMNIYPSYIKCILSDSEGIYIILKDIKDKNKISSINYSIIELYSTAVKNS